MEDDIIAGLRLDDQQRHAACQDGCDTVVLAGAGCGKTATLVAHYLYLLTRGLSPDEIVAITFTERAGQEMRVRIRRRLRDCLAAALTDRASWLERYTALDGAPIGTIHSFCARLLRTHPAEAGLDPDCLVLDEGQAAGLRAEAVERALVWAAEDPQTAACFPLLAGPGGLRRILDDLLTRRLEVEEVPWCSGPDTLARWQQARRQWLVETLHGPEWARCLGALEEMAPHSPGDALDVCRLTALEAVRAARRAADAGEWEQALSHLQRLQRPGNAGSRQNWGEQAAGVRRALRGLCDLHQAQVERVTANADPALDERLAAIWPGLGQLFHQAVRDYESLKAQRRAVDFDDLEAGALRLLENRPEVAEYWRARVRAVLVDEFQDTNERQRRLLEALVGAPAGQAGRLFIVGDAKQSIYRFRGADVTVFRAVEKAVGGAGGRTFRLDRTYRAHAGLLDILNDLLAAALGSEEDPARPYRVPFAALRPASGRPPALAAPFVELHLGLADTAGDGRRVAARALARRLARLHHDEGIGWGQMACLFRATTNFPLYEEAFEQAGIPYVTVAGTGFYERPEVRDLLNALRALANPADDLAMAGLLRSPAIGLADASLYLLRWGPGGQARPLWQALGGDLGMLDRAEQERARRAADIIAAIRREIGRRPVATILKSLLDLTSYRAILRLVPQTERADRNVDKLLADAQRSGAVGIGDFMQYVQGLRDVMAREGEAPPEAGEAVQLMSVHKAKGLEFGIVAIADAGHDDRARIPAVLLHPQWGLLIRVSRAEGAQAREGIAHGLAQGWEEALQGAEEQRLLYVAATRAKEKLLISGHAKPGKQGLSCQGWLKRIMVALGEEEVGAQVGGVPIPQAILCLEGRVSCQFYEPEEEAAEPASAAREAGRPSTGVAPLHLEATLARPYAAGAASEDAGTPEQVWRVILRRPGREGPAWVTGKLVHLGLRLWRFTREQALLDALGARARGAGLTDEAQIEDTVEKACRLLGRFHGSALYQELERAAERHYEVPYTYRPGVDPAGRIDLLCRLPGGWCIVEFKTHHLTGRRGLEWAIREYGAQLRRYRRAVRGLLGEEPRLLLCFLDYRGQVEVREVPT